MLVATHAGENGLQDVNRRAAFVVARLAVLRAALGAYLFLDHAWALALPEDQPISGELTLDLNYASSLAPDQPDFARLVPGNLRELVTRYRCEWLPIDDTGQVGASETPQEPPQVPNTSIQRPWWRRMLSR
jgi:hypothetical protein